MALARTQHWIITPPRSIKKKTFLAIVDQLPRVASYFPATDWNVRAEFAREGSREKAQGIKEVQALALSLLETATVSAFNLYLLLNGEGGRSCELRLSITGQKNELSISDVGTGWGKSLRDRAKRELKRYRVLTIWSRHGTRIIMRNFDHLFAVLASSIFILSYSDFQVTYRELLLGSAFAAPSVLSYLDRFSETFFYSRHREFIAIVEKHRRFGGPSLNQAALVIGAVGGLITIGDLFYRLLTWLSQG